MKEKMYEYFLSSYKYEEKNSNDFNFRFSNKYTFSKFNDEYNKFIFFLDNFYYSNNKFVTSINSLDVIVPKKYLKQIIKLYKYSIVNNYEMQKYIIGDFLLTYYNSINVYKKTNKKYLKIDKQFINIMNDYNIRYFYKQMLQDTSYFYLLVIKYGIKKDMYISPDVVSKIMNNVKDVIIKQKIVNELLKNDKYFFIIINYDRELQKNKKYYLSQIKKNIVHKFVINNTNNVFKVLLNNKVLTSEEIKKVINLYITRTNDLCNKYKDKSESFINALSDIESLKNIFLELLNTNHLDKMYKDKLHECIINILFLKRFLLSDDEYLISDMNEFSTTTKISNKKINEFIKGLEKNKYKIYGASSIDFDQCVKDSINYYSKFAIQSIFSSYHIDSKNQIYTTNKNFSSNYKYSFEKYYENLGRKYTIENKSKLLNIMDNGYYIEMLKELSRTFFIHQNITLSILGKDRFSELINNLKTDLNYGFCNDYGIIVGNILATELIINKLLSINSIKYTNNMALNISLLFEKYIDNRTARNGIMYLYYSLYEHSGLNLRNKAMHGSLINEDLRIPLLVSFSCVIFSSWLLNEKSYD